MSYAVWAFRGGVFDGYKEPIDMGELEGPPRTLWLAYCCPRKHEVIIEDEWMNGAEVYGLDAESSDGKIFVYVLADQDLDPEAEIEEVEEVPVTGYTRRRVPAMA